MGKENSDEFRNWPSRYIKPGDDGENEEMEGKYLCPCGCGSYSRGGLYLRGHRRKHKVKLRSAKRQK